MPPLPKMPQGSALLNFLKNLINNGFENFGRYYSVYRGYVFDADDPERLGRLQLIIPSVTGPDFHGKWAHPRNMPSGLNWGSKILPQKGDMVWVEFEGGNPEIPIWSHGHFGRKEIPADDPDLNDNNVYWFLTRKGALVKINDTKNTIHIKSQTGEILELNEKGVSLVSTRSVSLGTLNKSSQKAVLGDNLKDVLDDFEFIVNKLHTAMNKDVGKFNAMGFVNTGKTLPDLVSKVAGLKDKLGKILSNLNTLD